MKFLKHKNSKDLVIEIISVRDWWPVGHVGILYSCWRQTTEGLKPLNVPIQANFIDLRDWKEVEAA